MEHAIKSLSAKHPTGSLLLTNLWPVALGGGIGDFVANSAAWQRPGLIAVMSGAILQLLIALMRSLFAERKDTMNAMREMLREQRVAMQGRDAVSRRTRHELANRAHVAELENHLLKNGMLPEQLPRIKPLYDLDAEDKAEEGAMHITEV
jgi:hypothetical protein